jgi:hypothetical protein
VAGWGWEPPSGAARAGMGICCGDGSQVPLEVNEVFGFNGMFGFNGVFGFNGMFGLGIPWET